MGGFINNMKKLSLMCVYAGLFLANGLGAIQWEATTIVQTASVLAENVDGTFRFTNNGSEPVTFLAIKPSCGCTTTAMAKMTYLPGESGALTAKFNIGDRQGLQSKTIMVTIEGESAPTVLTMKTTIPKALEIKPSFVFWQQGDELDLKNVNLFVSAEGMHIVSATSDNNDVNVSLVTVVDGKHYRLNMTPVKTDMPLKAKITLKTDYPASQPKTYVVYAYVK